ncbi:ribosome hibernation-promoting factor, HPF/YfiA family [Thermovenabulum gondwanense]|uniref:Ribosome hibernation promoting factor n=1 Tax=Thermovenabulum gondwanense TaxID=520767 RepID=A0A162M5M1_9FIRM|nr:ribosome-associated translation inhibitor RaiA [Thermovenabulum gondwanense]KYO64126.1 putative sigma-54 modulation protein [Thermovenabulum gondwanense]
MRISVSGISNFEVTPALRDYAEKKIGRLSRHFNYLNNDSIEAKVKMHVENGRHIVEVTLSTGDLLLRGEEENKDMYAAIDLVADKLDKQIEKYKTKLVRSLRKNIPREATVLEDLNRDMEKEEEEKFRVVKIKRFPVKPMSVDEAILQMDLLGHNFFVFNNAETEEINVVYRRKDGNYGLIAPEY